MPIEASTAIRDLRVHTIAMHHIVNQKDAKSIGKDFFTYFSSLCNKLYRDSPSVFREESNTNFVHLRMLQKYNLVYILLYFQRTFQF